MNRYTSITPSQFSPLSLEEIMLVPAILYKEQISKEFQRKFYTEDMFVWHGHRNVRNAD